MIPEQEPVTSNEFIHKAGQRSYELSNHLGNVLSTVSDARNVVIAEEALYFNNDNIKLGTDNRGVTNEVTVELWMRTSQTTGQMCGVSKYSYGYQLVINNGKVNLTGRNGAGIYKTSGSGYFIADGEWHHVVGVTNGNDDWKLYVDGVLRESTNYGYGTPTLVSTAKLTVGSSASNQYYFQGDLKGLAIWNIEKSATEIAQNYGSTYQGTEANLVGYWPMNEGSSSSTIKDRVTNTNYSFYVGTADWQPGESYYAATILQTSDYYPFGMTMEGERNVSGEYRYSFNSLSRSLVGRMEKDDEIRGAGNSHDFGARMYDPRVARFNSIDPLANGFPFYSPYQIAGLSPIKFFDLDGLEAYIKGTAGDKLLNLLAQRSGLNLSLDANGLLTYATTTVTDGDGNETTEPVISKTEGSFISATLRNELIAVIDGVDANGNKKSVVEYLAYTSEEIADKNENGGDNVFFDSYGEAAIAQGTNGFVDVTDLENIAGAEELQASILTHITTERGYGSYSFGHPKAMKTEMATIQESVSGAAQRSDDLTILNQYNKRDATAVDPSLPEGATTYFYWDYKKVGYLFVVTSETTENKKGKKDVQINSNEVISVIKVE